MGVITDYERTLFRAATEPLWAVIHREASVERIPPRSDDEAAVVLVFMAPRRIMPPLEFTGIRTSSYFREHHSKQLQVAVPPELATPAELESFPASTFTEAPGIAMKALRRQKVVASMACAEEAAARIVENLDEVVAEACRTFESWTRR